MIDGSNGMYKMAWYEGLSPVKGAIFAVYQKRVQLLSTRAFIALPVYSCTHAVISLATGIWVDSVDIMAYFNS